MMNCNIRNNKLVGDNSIPGYNEFIDFSNKMDNDVETNNEIKKRISSADKMFVESYTDLGNSGELARFANSVDMARTYDRNNELFDIINENEDVMKSKFIKLLLTSNNDEANHICSSVKNSTQLYVEKAKKNSLIKILIHFKLFICEKMKEKQPNFNKYNLKELEHDMTRCVFLNLYFM